MKNNSQVYRISMFWAITFRFKKYFYIRLVVVLFFLCVFKVCFSQQINKDAVKQILINPALVTPDSLSTIIFQPLAIQFWGGGNKAAISLNDLAGFDRNFARDKILGTKGLSTGWAGISLTGPSAVFSINNKFTIGITSRSRFFANVWNIDGQFISEVEEDKKTPHTYPYNLESNNNMGVSATAWSELGLSLSSVLYKNDHHLFTTGFTLRYISGLSQASINVHIDQGTVEGSSSASYLTSSSGTVSTLTSGDLFNEFSLRNMFKTGLGNIGGDIGFSYEFHPLGLNKPYKLKIGASITDIGQLRFAPSPKYSKSYDMNIPTGQPFWLTANLGTTPFNHTATIFDNYPTYFKQSSVNSSEYAVSLPTAINITADYRLSNVYSFDAALKMGIQLKNTLNAMYVYKSVMLSPSYKRKNLKLFIPFSYQEYTGFNAGLGIDYGPLFFESGSLLSSTFTTTKNIDASFGFRTLIQGKKNKFKKEQSQVYLATYINNIREKGISLVDTIQNNDIPLNTSLVQQLHGFAEIQTINTTNNTIPFWMRSNQFGSNPIAGLSSAAILGFSKDYDTLRKRKLFDWGFGADGRVNMGTRIQGILVEGYIKGRFSIFQLKAGRSKDIVGLVDSSLSVGSFAVSGNTLGIPKVELSIPKYLSLPFWDKLIAIKGSLSHGWVGPTPLRSNSTTSYLVNSVNSYYHQLSFYGRVGRADWKVKILGGINHEVMWGNEKKIYGSGFSLSTINEYWHVLTGNSDGKGNSKIGNSIGSVDQGIEIDSKNIFILGYHQFFYDIGALGHLANIKDGLWGLSLKNKKKKNKDVTWNKLLIELLFSKNQAGEPGSTVTPSGSEDYYNNYLYKKGWSYQNENIGNPLFTNINYSRKNLAHHTDDFIVNNRVVAIHFAQESTIKKNWTITTKLTYSKNYGTWATAPAARFGDRVIYNDPPYFGEVSQFSGYLEVNKQLKNGYKIGGVFALDAGQLLYNSTGFILKVSKSFIK